MPNVVVIKKENIVDHPWNHVAPVLLQLLATRVYHVRTPFSILSFSV
jgi:hypothetical protein